MNNVIPSQEIVDKIPNLDVDVSAFQGKGSEQVADEISQMASEKGSPVRLSVASLIRDPEEKQKFFDARRILIQRGGECALFLLGNKQEDPDVDEDIDGVTDECTREITAGVVRQAAEAFKAFICKTLEDEGNYTEEFNRYVVTSKNFSGYDDLHYWKNLGLVEDEDGDPGVSEEIRQLRTEVNEIVDEVVGEAMAVLDRAEFTDEKRFPTREEKVRALILGMVSNMVRGVFYNYANAKKVYGMREMAVETLREHGNLRESV